MFALYGIGCCGHGMSGDPDDAADDAGKLVDGTWNLDDLRDSLKQGWHNAMVSINGSMTSKDAADTKRRLNALWKQEFEELRKELQKSQPDAKYIGFIIQKLDYALYQADQLGLDAAAGGSVKGPPVKPVIKGTPKGKPICVRTEANPWRCDWVYENA